MEVHVPRHRVPAARRTRIVNEAISHLAQRRQIQLVKLPLSPLELLTWTIFIKGYAIP